MLYVEVRRDQYFMPAEVSLAEARVVRMRARVLRPGMGPEVFGVSAGGDGRVRLGMFMVCVSRSRT